MLFITNARELDKLGKTDEAIDLIFDGIDNMLSSGKFKEVDDILKNVTINDWSDDLCLSFLAITLSAKSRLPSRGALFNKIKQRFANKEGILSGLE